MPQELLLIFLGSFSRVHYMYIGTVFLYGALFFAFPENHWCISEPVFEQPDKGTG